MALSDLAVFSEYSYTALIETIAQQIELFNAASRGCISLQAGSNQGDYSENAFYKRIAGLVRRRNAYGSGTVASKKLEHLVDTMVKVAAGTPPVSLDPGQFRWIQQNPEEAGAAMGQQLAQDMLADMLNVGIIAAYAALVQVTAVKNDVTGATDKKFSLGNMVDTAAKFGDRSSDLVAWLLHSAPMHSFYGQAATSTTLLFTYGTINVIQDPFGRVFVVTDSPGLVTAGSPNKYNNLALVSDAIRIEQNDDFDENMQTVNGDENIQRTYQAEWSYNVGVKGFAWDKSNGGKSPNDAALATSTNWDRYATSEKDLAGVLLISN